MGLAAILIEVPPADTCEAAQCTVPAADEVVLHVPTNAYGGVRYVRRICLGHYRAFQVIVEKARARGVDMRMQTSAEVAAEQQRAAHTSYMTFNSTSTTTTTNAFGGRW